MPWGAAVGAVASVAANKLMSSDKNGGAGAQTQTKEPWAAAQPWITSNMQQGQALQNQLTAQPFSPQQQAAYNNSYAQSDYMRNLVPSLLGQMQGQQVGFDRTGQQANKQTAWDWSGLLGSGSGAPNINQQSLLTAQAADEASKKKATEDDGEFKQFDATSNPIASYYGMLMSGMNGGAGYTDGGKGVKDAFTSALGDAGGSGYGQFKYGQPMPEKGTKAYRDMNNYFAYGGNDPFDLYGKMDRSALAPQAPGYTPAGGM